MSTEAPSYPYTWPNGARVCMLPSVVLEMWSEGTTPGGNMPAGFISANIKVQGRDLRVEKMIEFGAKVGMWRLLDILDQEEVLCSVFVAGRAAQAAPDLIRAYHRRGHEITAHGWAQDMSNYAFDDPEEERASIRRTVDAIERITGEQPVGWLSPRATPSINTLRLLAEEGFIWSGDYPDDELPYVEEVGDRLVAILPYSGQAVNDYEVTLIQGNSPTVFVDEFSRTLDFLLEQHDRTGRPGVVRASVHAHAYGRSWGRWAFRDVLRYAKSIPDVWIATRAQFARHVLAQHVELQATSAARPAHNR